MTIKVNNNPGHPSLTINIMVDPIHYIGIIQDLSISINFYVIGSISLDKKLVIFPLSIDLML